MSSLTLVPGWDERSLRELVGAARALMGVSFKTFVTMAVEDYSEVTQVHRNIEKSFACALKNIEIAI